MRENNSIAKKLDELQARCIVCNFKLNKKYLHKGKIRCYDCDSALGQVWPNTQKDFMDFFKGQE